MSNCDQIIQTKINLNILDTIPVLIPNENTSISLSPNLKTLFFINVNGYQTTTFTISLLSNIPPTNIGISVNFYQLNNNNTFIYLGSANITEMIMTFQKDFSPGTFIICISSQFYTYSGFFKGIFISYPLYVKFTPEMENGENMTFDLIFSYIERKCNKLLYYTLIDGEIPHGMTFLQNGSLYGVLPDMDCIEQNKNLSPSHDWYYKYGKSNTWFPWGRQWRFKIRVWIADTPEIFVDQWFCLRIFNNWSWNHIKFQDVFNDDNIILDRKYIEKKEKQISIKSIDLCCEKKEKIKPKTKPINKLCPCDNNNNDILTDEQSLLLKIIEWNEQINIYDNIPHDPHIKEFIIDFRKTEYYKNSITDDNLTQLEKEQKLVNKIIEDYTKSLNEDGRNNNDLDTLIEELKKIENQKLPITILAFNCETILSILTTDKKI